MEAIAPISLGWKEDQEQGVLSNVTYNETEIVGNDKPMKDLKDEADKQVIEDQHEKETSGVSVISLNNVIVTNGDNTEIPTKSKRLEKLQLQDQRIFYGNTRTS